MAFQKIMQYSPLIILAFIGAFFYPSFIDLVSVWTVWDQSMSHGIPLALMFVYFLWKSLPWPIVKASSIERFSLAVLLALLSLSWAIFYIAKIKILHQIILLPILIVALAFGLGLKNVLKYRILLVLPIYVIPIWDYMNDYLVHLSSAVVAELVRAINMPALIEGNSIQIPSGHIVIAGGCSGLRYLIISLCLAHTISYMNGYKEKGLIICLLTAAALGLITNWIRIFLLIYIGYSTEMKSSLMEDHETFGWVLFAVICFIAIYFAPVVKSKSPEGESLSLAQDKNRFIALGGMLLVLALGPITVQGLKMLSVVPHHSFIANTEYYQKSMDTMPVEVIVPSSDFRHRLASQGEKIAVQIDEYTPRDSSTQLVPYISRTYDQDLWKKIAFKKITINQKAANWQVLRNNASGKIAAQVQWFNVGNYQVASVNEAKLYQVPAFFKRQIYFAIVTLQIECQDERCIGNEPALIDAASHLNQQ
jgi:exosortase